MPVWRPLPTTGMPRSLANSRTWSTPGTRSQLGSRTTCRRRLSSVCICSDAPSTRRDRRRHRQKQRAIGAAHSSHHFTAPQPKHTNGFDVGIVAGRTQDTDPVSGGRIAFPRSGVNRTSPGSSINTRTGGVLRPKRLGAGSPVIGPGCDTVT